jgi:hypothetical protein
MRPSHNLIILQENNIKKLLLGPLGPPMVTVVSILIYLLCFDNDSCREKVLLLANLDCLIAVIHWLDAIFAQNLVETTKHVQLGLDSLEPPLTHLIRKDAMLRSLISWVWGHHHLVGIHLADEREDTHDCCVVLYNVIL